MRIFSRQIKPSSFIKSFKGSFLNFSKIKFSSPAENSNNHDAQNDKEPGFLEMVQMYFDGAAKHIDIPKSYLNLIKSTKSAIKFNFPLVKDDGTIQVIQAYRAQHSLHYLPTKGVPDTPITSVKNK